MRNFSRVFIVGLWAFISVASLSACGSASDTKSDARADARAFASAYSRFATHDRAASVEADQLIQRAYTSCLPALNPTTEQRRMVSRWLLYYRELLTVELAMPHYEEFAHVIGTRETHDKLLKMLATVVGDMANEGGKLGRRETDVCAFLRRWANAGWSRRFGYAAAANAYRHADIDPSRLNRTADKVTILGMDRHLVDLGVSPLTSSGLALSTRFLLRV